MSAAKSVAKVIYLKHLPYGTTLDEVSSWFPIKSVDYVSWSSRRPNHCFVGFRHLKLVYCVLKLNKRSSLILIYFLHTEMRLMRLNLTLFLPMGLEPCLPTSYGMVTCASFVHSFDNCKS